MSEHRKLAAILAADVVGYSRLAGADEDRTLARLRALRSDLIDPTIAVHNGEGPGGSPPTYFAMTPYIKVHLNSTFRLTVPFASNIPSSILA